MFFASSIGASARRPAGQAAHTFRSSELPKAIFGYDVIDFIGEGAGSLIYVVAEAQTRQLYALKHVVKRTEKDARFLDQLVNEFEISRHFVHAGLRKSLAMKDDRAFLHKPTEAALVMELFDGAPLDAYRPETPISAVECFAKVAEALASMHSAGYVHCDLKPNNILLGSSSAVKVIDFGQACKVGTIKERIQGTPDYIAPEQVRRDAVTVRTDVFNFGATLYWVLTGKTIPTLFKLDKSENSFLLDNTIASPHQLDERVPAPLSNLVMECVRSNPAKRPADMSEVARRLEIIRHGMLHPSSHAVAIAKTEPQLAT